MSVPKTLRIVGQSGTIDVTPGSVSTGNPGPVIVIVNGITVPTNDDGTLITVADPGLVVHGNIQVQVLNPVNLDLSETNGNISAEGVSAQMNFSVVNGTIITSAVTLTGHSHFRTDAGTILFNGSLGTTGTETFETNHGFISTTLPSNAGFHLDAIAQSGTVSTNFPVPPHPQNSIQ